jgi:serine/threonine protein kinase
VNDPADHTHEETFAASPSDKTLKPASGISFRKDSAEFEIKDYSIADEIGRGGMGSVVAANDPRLERTVALKVMLATDAGEAATRRFEREARVLARLEHPNIIPVHEVGITTDGRPFYTMKLVKGRTLQSIIEGIRNDDTETTSEYPLDKLLTVFRKVCDAVAFAHHVGIVHRDLKPDNVMVGEFGEVLVMDWGLAKLLDEAEEESDISVDLSALKPTDSGSLTLDGQILGTPQYMAPEQAAGQLSKIAAGTDVYSLGGILQAILTLRAPISGSTLQEMIGRIGSGDRNPIITEASPDYKHCPGRKIPVALAAVAEQAMAVSSAERYPSVDDLAKEVVAFQGGFTTQAEQATLSRRFSLYVNRNKTLIITAMLGVTGMVYTFAGGLKYLRIEQRRLYAEVAKYRDYQKDLGSMRWVTVHRFPPAKPAPDTDGWNNIWEQIIADRGNPHSGPWLVGRRALMSPGGGRADLPLPVAVGTSGWSLRMTLRKVFKGGAFAIQIPHGDRHLPFLVDAGKADDRITGFRSAALESTSTDGLQIKANAKLYWFQLSYQPQSDTSIHVTATLDGHEIFDWTGDPAELEENPYWTSEFAGRLALGAAGGNWVIERLSFRPE